MLQYNSAQSLTPCYNSAQSRTPRCMSSSQCCMSRTQRCMSRTPRCMSRTPRCMSRTPRCVSRTQRCFFGRSGETDGKEGKGKEEYKRRRGWEDAIRRRRYFKISWHCTCNQMVFFRDFSQKYSLLTLWHVESDPQHTIALPVVRLFSLQCISGLSVLFKKN